MNVGAWLAGLVLTFLPSPLVDEATPPALTAVLFGIGGVGMAVTVAVLTGLGPRSMLTVGRPDSASEVGLDAGAADHRASRVGE